jgi:hypothetical protein
MGFFRDRVSRTILPGLALNHDPPDLCLLSSKDYRRETQHQAYIGLLEALHVGHEMNKNRQGLSLYSLSPYNDPIR